MTMVDRSTSASRCAALKPREVLLVHGASGGVGMAAVQLGKHLGARVIATGSDDRRLAVVREQGADLVIYDSTYTDAEFPKRADWGHSTWEEGVRLCDMAGAKTFVVFHHDPDHDDDFMDGIAKVVTEKRPGSIVAKEGLVLRP